MSRKISILIMVMVLAAITFAAEAKTVATSALDIVKIGSGIDIKQGEKANNVVAVGGSVSLNGEAQQDVVAVGGSVILGSKAVVGGKVVSVGGSINKAEGAQIKGNMIETKAMDVSTILYDLPNKKWKKVEKIFKGAAFIGFLALALLIVALFPNQIGKVSVIIEKSPVKSFLWAILGVLLIVPVAILLAISLVGILLIPVELVLVGLSVLFGYIATAQLLGKKVAAALRKMNLPIFWETFWGIIVLWLISWIPFVGGFICMIVSLLGFGGVLKHLLNLKKCC
ncbi:MAG: hypothetical protein PHV30_03325 [Candidatus Margulisbacteria bacterium]|nr:hypothetical protein [Candidatus Margulisiibacteriota bacterium]